MPVARCHAVRCPAFHTNRVKKFQIIGVWNYKFQIGSTGCVIAIDLHSTGVLQVLNLLKMATCAMPACDLTGPHAALCKLEPMPGLPLPHNILDRLQTVMARLSSYSAGPPPWSNLENSLKLQIQLDLDQTWRQFINRLVACTQRQKFTLTRLDQELAWISPPTHTSGNACFKTFWYGSNQLVYVCTQTHTSETWSVMC